jgi:hypothetical protein
VPSGLAVLFYATALFWHEDFRGKVIPGFLLLQISVIGWVFGSLLQKRANSQVNSFVTSDAAVCRWPRLRLKRPVSCSRETAIHRLPSAKWRELIAMDG